MAAKEHHLQQARNYIQQAQGNWYKQVPQDHPLHPIIGSLIQALDHLRQAVEAEPRTGKSQSPR